MMKMSARIRRVALITGIVTVLFADAAFAGTKNGTDEEIPIAEASSAIEDIREDTVVIKDNTDDLSSDGDDDILDACITDDPEEDLIWSMSFDKDNDYIEWDSTRGPYYRLCLSSGNLEQCSSDGAKVISYEYKGNTVKVTVESNERPEVTQYVFDLTKPYPKYGDQVYNYQAYSNGLLIFNSMCLGTCSINYKTKSISTTFSDNTQLISADIDESKLCLVIKSDNLTQKVRYTFDVSNMISLPGNVTVEPEDADMVDFFSISSENCIMFDTIRGPYYCIDYKAKKIIECTSTNPELISCDMSGDILSITVKSDELPQQVKYIFDLSPHYDDDERIYDARIITDRETDVIEWMSYDINSDTIEWDTTAGPLYRLRLTTGELLDCTSGGVKIFEYEYRDNKVRVTLQSDERPVKTTYLFDLTQEYPDCIDLVTDYSVYSDGIIAFYSQKGTDFEIDYKNKKIVRCSARYYELISVSENGNLLEIVLRTENIPKKVRYTFDLGKKEKVNDDVKVEPSGADRVEYYYYRYGNIIEFDSRRGPYYRIDYKSGKILDCTSDGAVIREKSLKDNTLTLKLYSNELPQDVTYYFDLTKSSEAEDLDQNDQVEWYTVNKKEKTVSFDTTCGPLYQIDYKKKTILGCTSDNALIKKCEVKNKILELTVYSSERPTDSTYKFDLTKNKEQENDDGMGYGDFDGNDPVDYFNILSGENAIEFDSRYGPYYKISLRNGGKMLECTSDDIFPNKPKAKILKMLQYEDMITLTVYSAELPHKMTYVFNTSRNVQAASVTGYETDSFDKEVNGLLQSIYTEEYRGKGVSPGLAKRIREAKRGGKRITAVLETRAVSEDKVNEEKKNKIEEYLKGKKDEVVQYLDISIAVYADDERLGYITELDRDINFYLGMIGSVTKAKKSFGVVRCHEGETDYLNTKKKGKDKMSFASKKFSTFVIVGKNKKSVSNLSVTVAKSKVYSGKKQTPKVKIKDGNKVLKEGTDYTLKYSDNLNVGKASVKISGKNNYTGTVSRSFKIVPKGTDVKKLTAGKGSFTLKWKPVKKKMKKSYITGYQVQYSTSGKFVKNSKTVNVPGYKKDSISVNALKGRQKYHVRIRTYMKVGGSRYYSAWSKAKKVTVN